jgi:biopolymer transport protein ExbD
MARHRLQRRESFADESEPDLTPLIDCVFLLLIFFMVTTVFLHTKGLDVDLPADNQSTEEQKKDINVVLDREGQIQIKGEDVASVDLGERLVESMKAANNDNIIIQADNECAQRYVIYVVDTAKEVGVQGIAFVREQEQ